MKYFFLTFLLPLLFWVQKDPVVEWTTPVDYDLGDISRTKKTDVLFHYKNISKEPITIDNVRVTCGCTAPDWLKAPIEPDSTGTIKIVFHPKQTGYFRKKIRVFFNAQRKAELLYVGGYVEE